MNTKKIANALFQLPFKEVLMEELRFIAKFRGNFKLQREGDKTEDGDDNEDDEDDDGKKFFITTIHYQQSSNF